ncbi:hypothetical protein M405DRAFT_70773 [Rhizopogon salebrosus TDB-379]|nr:hypothetical protein M405DRAFT_70773 [Rhizopogon salebrosus TDB-379]
MLRLLIPKGLYLIYVRRPGERTVIPLQPLTTWTVSSMTHHNAPLHTHLLHQIIQRLTGVHPCHHPNTALVRIHPHHHPSIAVCCHRHMNAPALRPPPSPQPSNRCSSGSVQDEELTPPPATPSLKCVRRGRRATRRKR